MLNLKVIVGSTRPNRFSEKLLPWLKAELDSRPELAVEVLDLKDYPLPFFNQATNPSHVTDGNYGDPAVTAWAQKIGEADAYLIITPEYNRSFSAVLKNAIDVVYGEWNRKAVSFISYGSLGGGRAVEQLRQVAVELQLASTRSAVHIPAPWTLREENGDLKSDALTPYTAALQTTLDQLTWWGEALKNARNK